MPYGGADDDCFVSVPGLVDRDSLSLDSTWIHVLVECPCDTRGCIWLFAHDECLHHFHFSGFFWRNSTISLVVLPVPCSLATRWRKSGSRRLPYAFAHASYAFFTLSSTRACTGHRSAVACSVSIPHTRQPKGRTTMFTENGYVSRFRSSVPGLYLMLDSFCLRLFGTWKTIPFPGWIRIFRGRLSNFRPRIFLIIS